MRRFGAEERRARLAVRHHLAPTAPGADVVTVAERLVGLHASDPATVYLAARARVPGLAVADVERALYDDRSVVRHLCMRRTLFVVPARLLPVVQGACTEAVAGAARRALVRDLEAAGVTDDGERWLRDAEQSTMEVLVAAGDATGAELSRAVPALRVRLRYGEGKTWGGEIGVATRVLTVMAAEGRIVRGRPNGSWTSGRHRWVPVAGPAAPPMPADEARVELVRRWLGAFGPATVDDVVWWTGLGTRPVRTALAAAGAVEVEVEGEAGVVGPDDLEPAPAPEPWAALLPSLDPTTMGWRRRAWYLGAHGPELFDRNGNAGPTVWFDGRIVGGWAQRVDGEVVHRLLDDIGDDGAKAVEDEVAGLQRWLGTTRVTPRFRTPVERALRA